MFWKYNSYVIRWTAGKKEIGERATKLIEIGTALKDKQRKMGRGSRWSRRRQRSNYNKFRQVNNALMSNGF